MTVRIARSTELHSLILTTWRRQMYRMVGATFVWVIRRVRL